MFFTQRSKPESESEGQALTEESVEMDIKPAEVVGDAIEANGNIHIESLDERSIEMAGNLVIGPTASFKGKIRVEGDARIEGIYEGSIETTGELTISSTADYRGTLQADGIIRVDGTYVGNIRTDSDLVVGNTAKILADIAARNVSVAGAVKGDIAADNVEVKDTGRIWGDLTVRSFTLQDGGFVSGRVKMPTDISPTDLFGDLESTT